MDSGARIAGRFLIQRPAGSGGMASVYRALDESNGEPVAVKIFSGADPSLAARFARESRLLAELSHPAIVRYVSHGELDTGERYLVMEWLEGHDLAEHLTQGPLSVADSIAVVRRAAEALSAAHARGVIHRDVKPSNLFLPHGRLDALKVLDFGVARGAELTNIALTRTGVAMGTPGYMAPEQARGEREVNARADVYALGCVAFECISGRPPFQGATPMAMLVKAVIDPTPHLADRLSDVPPAVDTFVAELMAKDSEQRPFDGAAVLARISELGELGEHRTLSSLPRSPALTTMEQRLLSVIIAAACASPQSSTSSNPEEHDTVIEEGVGVLEEAVRIAKRFRGRLEMLAGGALLVTFTGSDVPTDQAARAARCALELQRLLAPVALALATGRGASVGTSTSVESEAVHQAVHLIQTAQANDEQGTAILLDEATFGLLHGRFEIFHTPLGYALISELDTLHAERKLFGRGTPFVGRDREVAMLLATFDECAAEPVARAVLLIGPPGVGKSRIRQEAMRRLRERGTKLEPWIARGDAMSAGSPLGMLASAVRAAVGLIGAELKETQRERLLERTSRRLPPDDALRVARFLGEMIGAPFPAGVDPQLDAARADVLLLGDQMRRAFEDLLAAECRAQPVVFVLEDLQWSDVATVKFIDSALRNLAGESLFVLATARPEVFDTLPNLWAERGLQQIGIGPLTPRASTRLVRHVMGAEAGDAEVERIVEHGAGHPLMLEEILRAFAEKRSETLPDTALAMVESRMMALNHEARRVLRAASVFGRSFWASGVRALLAGPSADADLQGWLRALSDGEWIVRREISRFGNEEEYGFAQDVVREAAYAMLTPEDRALGHRLAGMWLEKMGERDGVVLARHFELGDERARALLAFELAAEQALDGNDFDAVIAHGERAVKLDATGVALGRVRALQAEAHMHKGELEPALALGRDALERLTSAHPAWFRAAAAVALSAGKQGHLEVLKKVALGLIEARVEARTRVPFASAAGCAAVQLVIGGELSLADALLAELDRLECSLPVPDPAISGHHARAAGARAAFSQDPGRSLILLRKAVDAYDAAGDLRSACSLRKTQGWYAAEAGALEEGEQALVAAIAAAERLGLVNLVAHARFDLGSPLIRLGKLERARRELELALPVFVAQHDHRLESGVLAILSSVDRLEGKHEAAVARAERALATAPTPPIRISALSYLAHALLDAGRIAEARARAEEGLELLAQFGSTEEGVIVLYLVRAETLHAAGDLRGAVRAIEEARANVVDRAMKISDVAIRETFLSRIWENCRTLERANEWVDIPSQEQTES